MCVKNSHFYCEMHLSAVSLRSIKYLPYSHSSVLIFSFVFIYIFNNKDHLLIIKNNLPQHTLIFYLHTAIIIIIFPFFHSRIFIYFLLLSPAQVQLNRNLRIIPLWVSLYSNSFYDDILKRSAAREEKIYCYDGFNLQLYHSYVFFILLQASSDTLQL